MRHFHKFNRLELCLSLGAQVALHSEIFFVNVHSRARGTCLPHQIGLHAPSHQNGPTQNTSVHDVETLFRKLIVYVYLSK